MSAPSRPLAGKHAIVTGASRGIGQRVAELIAQAGGDVTLVGRDMERLQANAAQLMQAHGVKTLVAATDVADPQAIEATYAKASQALGAPAILVNNAGQAISAPIHKTDLELWNRMIGVNLSGVYMFTKAALPAMTKAGWGRVVNVASTAGLRGYAYVSAYCAAKHGVIGLTRAVAQEVAIKGVTINAVCPGYVDSDMTDHTLSNIMKTTGRSREEALSSIVVHNPQKRLVSTDEVAQAVLWLCLPSQGAINGQALGINGGEV